MNILALLFILLPIAAFSGWYISYRYYAAAKKTNRLTKDYFVGLKYLIDEQPDKAIDVFIKMLDVNSDTVETHLALGGLFRKRGEVERATRIHQNLIARPQLDKEQRVQALFELAQDYMHAGVLNRAEKLLLELAKTGGDKAESYEALLHIYEQEKDWERAIFVAEKLAAIKGTDVRKRIAHYYCELNNPKKALLIDRSCVRANIMQGRFYAKDGNWKAALKAYKKVVEQDPNYISEVISDLERCYIELKSEAELVTYLKECLQDNPRVVTVLALAEIIRKHENDFLAIEFTVEQMRNYPSLRGLIYLIDLYSKNAAENTRTKLLLLQEFMRNFIAEKPKYRCSECGFAGKQLYWQCPGCREWNTVKPIHGLEGD